MNTDIAYPEKPQSLENKATTSFLNPRLFRQSNIPCVVAEDGVTVLFASDKAKAGYCLINAREAGEALYLTVCSYHTEIIPVKALDDYDAARKTAQEARRQQAKIQRAEALKNEKCRAKAHNQSLNIPFKWALDNKTVLSGLSYHSSGDGLNRASVTHVRVMEDFKDGRFSREAGDFLCGKDNSKYQGYSEPEAWENSARKVTCKQCLKAAKRFQS